MPVLTTPQAEALIAALSAGRAISRREAADLMTWGRAQPALNAAFDDPDSAHHREVRQWHDLVSYLATDHPQAEDGRPQPLTDPDKARLDDKLDKMSARDARLCIDAGLADPMVQHILADRHHREHRQLAADWSRLHEIAHPGRRDEHLRPVAHRDPGDDRERARPPAGKVPEAAEASGGGADRSILPGRAPLSPAEAKAAIAELDADPLAALQDPLHPRHGAARTHRSALFDMAHPKESPDAGARPDR